MNNDKINQNLRKTYLEIFFDKNVFSPNNFFTEKYSEFKLSLDNLKLNF